MNYDLRMLYKILLLEPRIDILHQTDKGEYIEIELWFRDKYEASRYAIFNLDKE